MSASSTAGTSGRISSFSSNSRSLPSSNEVTSIFGRRAGRSWLSPMVRLEPSSTASSSTSPRIERPYCFFSSGRGALPGRKPGSRTVLAQLLQPGLDPLLDLARRDGDLELALEALGRNLLYLHRSPPRSPPTRRGRGLHIQTGHRAGLVRAARLELARLAPQEPKSCVSTNSTTPARGIRSASARGCALSEGRAQGRRGWKAQAEEEVRAQTLAAKWPVRTDRSRSRVPRPYSAAVRKSYPKRPPPLRG